MHQLMPRSDLHIYHGGRLDLVLEAEPMAAIVEPFLTVGNDPSRKPPITSRTAPQQ